jgi:uncharacterized peroxidase-related enzyme
MRLREIGGPPTWRGRFRMRAMKLVAGGVPDVVTTLECRPAIFGVWFHAGLQRLLRESTAWTPMEGELLATEVSRANTCDFCAGIHSNVTAGLLAGDYPDEAALEAQPALKAAVEFARKVTREPRSIVRADVEKLRRHGLSGEAIEEIAYISAFFSTINRTANALDFDLLEGRQLRWASRMLRWLGYYDV